MRDAGRINKVLSKIRKIWKRYPDLRLMQLLLNAVPDWVAYNIEDDKLLINLDETYPRGETDIISGFEPDVGGSNPSEGTKRPFNNGDVLRGDVDVLQDLLSLVSYNVPIDIIKTWSPELRQCAEEWAVAQHLVASDNILEVPARPDCLDGYEDDEI